MAIDVGQSNAVQQFPARQSAGERVLVVFGTRPEAIKMAPFVSELRACTVFDAKICVTAQVREGQKLADLTARVLTEISGVCRRRRPGLMLVHGDTSTTLAASLAAFYEKSPVARNPRPRRTRSNCWSCQRSTKCASMT
jgi:UDP-N-acetylglucosamine 2-epimerase (non-hydrolysing)